MEKGNLQFLTQLGACRFSSLSDSAFCLIGIWMHQQLKQWQCISVSISLALPNCTCGTVAARVGHWKSKIEITIKWSEICVIRFIEHTGMSMGNRESLPRHPALAPGLPQQLVLGHPWVKRAEPHHHITRICEHISIILHRSNEFK